MPPVSNAKPKKPKTGAATAVAGAATEAAANTNKFPYKYINSLYEYVNAGYPAVWLQSQDHNVAINDMLTLCTAKDWQLGYWDMADGLLGTKHLMSQQIRQPDPENKKYYDKKPFMLIQDFGALAAKTQAKRTLFVLKNFHRRDFLDNPAVLQAVLNSADVAKGATHGWMIIVLSPVLNIPIEWNNHFVALEHDLPDKNYLRKLAVSLSSNVPTEKLGATEEERNVVFDSAIRAASGMTHMGAENAFSLSIIRNKTLNSDVIHSEKNQLVKRSGTLKLMEGDDTFDDMGGLEQFKKFSLKLLESDVDNPLLASKGLLLLGVPGSGKSQAVKCLGNATKRPVISLDMGALRSKFQGETDQNIREALRIADATAPCILFIDELEKALSGNQSSSMTDGGTGSRMFGTLLTWLNDHKSDVFFVGTCNDVGQLLGANPEFARAERFDGMFFFDLPSVEERKTIWNIYIKMYGIKTHPKMTDLLVMSDGWTGAEIRACCRLSRKLDQSIQETAKTIVPIMTTATDRLNSLRDWADGRCMSTSQPGLFRKDGDRAPVSIDISSATRNLTTNKASQDDDEDSDS